MVPGTIYEPGARRRVGILGGTFNPVHQGHLVLARGVLQALGLDRVIWIPARIPPLKPVEGNVSADDRCRMVELAIAGEPGFELSRVELDRNEPSYTVDTLRQLTRARPGVSWFVIVGSDLVEELPQWRDIREALQMATFVAAPRPRGPFPSLPPGIRRVDVPTVEISSSDIRRRIRAGQPFAHLVPEQVARYLADRRLYQ